MRIVASPSPWFPDAMMPSDTGRSAAPRPRRLAWRPMRSQSHPRAGVAKSVVRNTCLLICPVSCSPAHPERDARHDGRVAVGVEDRHRRERCDVECLGPDTEEEPSGGHHGKVGLAAVMTAPRKQMASVHGSVRPAPRRSTTIRPARIRTTLGML